MENRMIPNETQQQMEEYMVKTVRENIVDQAGRINGMIAPEYVACSREEQWAELRYPTQPWQTNRMDVVHGGIITTCLDNAMAILNMFLAGQYFTPTVTMEMKYLRPLPVENNMRIRVEAISTGKKLSHLRGTVRDEKTGKVVAAGTATFMTTGLAVRK